MISIMHFFIVCLLACVAMATPALYFEDDGSAEVHGCMDGNGHVYAMGERMPDVDDCHAPCWCDNEGVRMCRNRTCDYPACVDVQPPGVGECCPRCPNGANCRLGDGFLQEGETRTETFAQKCSKVCQCLYGGQDAICILQCDDVPPLDLFTINQLPQEQPAARKRPGKQRKHPVKPTSAEKKQRRRRRKKMVFKRWRWP